MRTNSMCALALVAALSPLATTAGAPVDIEVVDRKSGRVLPVYWHEGERHIAGEPGREYEIRIRNQGAGRVLAVTSVDGVNVITGRTASPDQSGYVVDPWCEVDIDGWRKSMERVAAFYFTALPDSYAARTGRPDDVGVIGVALFRERVWRMPMEGSFVAPDTRARSAGAAPERESPSTAVTGRDLSDDSLHGRRDENRLGTGHGRRIDSSVVYTEFERASEEPDEIIRIFYDSRRNLVARGVIPRPWYRVADRQPDPFPGGFVPDP